MTQMLMLVTLPAAPQTCLRLVELDDTIVSVASSSAGHEDGRTLPEPDATLRGARGVGAGRAAAAAGDRAAA